MNTTEKTLLNPAGTGYDSYRLIVKAIEALRKVETPEAKISEFLDQISCKTHSEVLQICKSWFDIL